MYCKRSLFKSMRFIVYGKVGCPHSIEAEKILNSIEGVPKEMIWVEGGEEAEKLKKKHNHPTFPQIFFEADHDGQKHRLFVGGCDKLKKLVDVAREIKDSKLPLPAVLYITRKLQNS